MTDEKIRAAVEIAQRAIELSHRVSPEGLKKSKELMTLAHAVVELSAELAALKEKYRWRKHSEEPAPDNLEIEIYDISANAIFVPEGPVYIANSRYWRPLDLPEGNNA